MTTMSHTERFESPITSPIVRDLDDPSGVTITVVGGSVDVVAAPMTRTARLEIHELAGPPLSVTNGGGTVKIEQLRDTDGQVWGVLTSLLPGQLASGTRPSARLTLAIPDHTRVTIRTVSADVLVGGTHGAVTIQTVSGDVTLDRTTGPVDITTVGGSVDSDSPTGEFAAKTVSGGITVQDAAVRSSRISTVGGRVVLGVRHGPSVVSANSVSGDISVRLPAGCGYDATVTSASGTVTVDGETLAEGGKRGGHRYAGDRGVVVKGRTMTGPFTVVRQTTNHPAAGPVIGDTWSPSGEDIQDDVRPHDADDDSPRHRGTDDGTGEPR